VRIYIISITLNYKRILCTEITYINYLTNNLDIFVGKTPVPNSSALFTYPFINRKPYYNNNLSLNESINLTSIGL